MAPWWLSAILPGLGQLALGRRQRGLVVLAVTAVALGLVAWLGEPALGPLVLLLWPAAALDAWRLARGRRGGAGGWLLVAAALPIYAVAWQATGMDPAALVQNFDNIRPLLAAFANPTVLCRANTDLEAEVQVLTPCPLPPAAAAAEPAPGEPGLVAVPGCADLGAAIAIRGRGFPPGAAVTLYWESSQGNRRPQPLATASADAAGAFGATVRVPEDAAPLSLRLAAERSGRPIPVQTQAVVAVAPGPPGPWELCRDFRLILAGMGVTIAVGFLATVLGALLALPFSILGAKNLMGGHPLSLAVYTGARMVMNVVRAIEPLIMAVVFVVWVGQGPFAGMLALTAHTVAALGKLFSEAIEDIDPGPVEALRSTGARWLQQVAFAVVPQVVSPFIAFTVYRWDINVRMSTVIGFVGGGGIGFLVYGWIQLGQWAPAATALYAIAVVVLTLDFVSAALRRRVEAGQGLLPAGRVARPLAWLGLLLFTAWSWQVSQVNVRAVLQDAGKMGRILGELARPDLVAYEVVTDTVRAGLVVPCSLALPPAAPTDRLAIAPGCADAGGTVTVTGSGFGPGQPVRLRWLLADGRPLPALGLAQRPATDAAGRFTVAVPVRPLVASSGEAAGALSRLEATASRDAGAPAPSATVRTTASLLVETLLMALLATTLGALVALPLAFLAARNIMPASPAGNGAYLATRAVLNLLRALEPVVLALLFATWVGAGTAFPGVLALTVVTIAGLGKLASEAIENAEGGPMEALWATGSRRLQMVAYAVVPQVVLTFLAFGIYTWDINVRLSTIVGLVGGGGIGAQLRDWISQLQWSKAAVAILGIVLVVSVMDFASARLRQQLGQGDRGGGGPAPGGEVL